MTGPKPAWRDDVSPEFSGVAHVWPVTIATTDDPRAETTIGTWLIFAPSAHPFWSWHVMFMMALREHPGVPPAKLQFPGAAYEVLVLALDPDKPVPDPRATTPGAVAHMLPPDAAVQIIDPGGDDRAREILRAVAQAVAGGTLIPDSDYAEFWRESLTATAEHFAEGRH